MSNRQATAQQPIMLTPEQFLRASKAKTVRVASNRPYVDGGRVEVTLPQAGLGHCLYVIVKGTITVGGTVSGGTFRGLPNPGPWGIIQRMTFGSNNAFKMRDLSAWSWYKWLRYRYGIDPTGTDNGASYSANTLAALGLTGANRIVPGANVAAQTYTVNLMLPLPLSYNDAAEQGLIVLQQNAIFYTLGLQFAQITSGITGTGGSNDLFNGLTGTSITVTANLTYSVGLNYFEAVPGIGRLTSMFMSVNDQVQSPLVTGENVVKLPPNDFYTMCLFEHINNGAPVGVANIQNPTFMHSGNVYDHQDDYDVRLMHSYFQHRQPPVDGVTDYDFGMRRGVISRRDTLDGFDNRLVTDAQYRVTIPGTLTITGLNGINSVFETLRYIQQGG